MCCSWIAKDGGKNCCGRQFMVSPFTAVNPVTQSISCVVLLHKLPTVFFDLVAMAELSVVVGMGSATLIETVVGLTSVVKTIRPSVAGLERVSDTL